MGVRRRGRPGRADPLHPKLALGTWNITSMEEKEPELVCELEWYNLTTSLARLHTQRELWNQTPGEGLNSLIV